jgi:hypothetical protein
VAVPARTEAQSGIARGKRRAISTADSAVGADFVVSEVGRASQGAGGAADRSRRSRLEGVSRGRRDRALVGCVQCLARESQIGKLHCLEGLDSTEWAHLESLMLLESHLGPRCSTRRWKASASFRLLIEGRRPR